MKETKKKIKNKFKMKKSKNNKQNKKLNKSNKSNKKINSKTWINQCPARFRIMGKTLQWVTKQSLNLLHYNNKLFFNHRLNQFHKKKGHKNQKPKMQYNNNLKIQACNQWIQIHLHILNFNLNVLILFTWLLDLFLDLFYF
jgi:hypothetical protein